MAFRFLAPLRGTSLGPALAAAAGISVVWTAGAAAGLAGTTLGFTVMSWRAVTGAGWLGVGVVVGVGVGSVVEVTSLAGCFWAAGAAGWDWVTSCCCSCSCCLRSCFSRMISSNVFTFT